eukprot:PITA_14347
MSPTMDVPTQQLSNGIQKLMSNGINNLKVQDRYILPPNERPQMAEVCYSESIPVIDLEDLHGPNRMTVVHQIRRACEEDGFFQIVNHGVPENVMKNMMEVAKEFYEMPVEDRACLYSEDEKQLVRLFTSVNLSKDKVLNWVDYLTQPCHPLEEVIDSWAEKPAAYRDIAGKYAGELRALILRLLAAISEALGLEFNYLNKILGKHSQVMTINYYPSCPNPDLTRGLPNHSDGSALTVLMQSNVSGLQVFRNGKWVAVEPVANAFVVNLGDQLQVVSNGRFRSVEHRVVTNMQSARISIPTFYSPSDDAFIAPAISMVNEQQPALYRGYKFEEYVATFWNHELKGKSLLDRFMI